MKSLTLVLFSLLLSNAHAGWVEMKCSNSDGSVRWQKGVDEDLIHLKYSNFIEGTVTFELDKVHIEMKKTVTLREKSFKDCRYEGKGRVFAGKVRIIGSEKHPNILRSYFPENRVQTEVICTTVETIPTEC